MSSATYIIGGLLTTFVSGFVVLVVYYSLTPAFNLLANIGLAGFGNINANMPILIQHVNLIYFSGFTFVIIGLVITAYGLTFRNEPSEFTF